MGDNRPYPGCHEWNQRVMPKLIADHPDFVFTTSTRPWNIKPGDVMPATYIGIWQTLSDNNIPILAMRDTPWMVRNGQPYCENCGMESCSRGVLIASWHSTGDHWCSWPRIRYRWRRP